MIVIDLQDSSAISFSVFLDELCRRIGNRDPRILGLKADVGRRRLGI